MSRELPEKPNLEHLKKQAKDLLRQLEQGDSTAAERFAAISITTTPKLADALHVVAREYGFGTWPELKEHVESLTRAVAPAHQLAAAIRASNAGRVSRVLEEHPELRRQLDAPIDGGDSGPTPLLEAVMRTDRATIDVLLRAGASIHSRGHEWSGGMSVLDECGEDLADFLIERGARLDLHSAVRLGRIEEVRVFLAANPEAIHSRGARGQTPLHFAPTVEIATLLLDHGAEIDAPDLLHESTPAQHMLRVVQARYYRHDRRDIARFLVARGCHTDLLMAAALGDLPLVRRHLDSTPGSIRTAVTDEFFPKHDPRSSGTIYRWIFGPRKTAHLIARDFGHDEVFGLLMDRSPEDLRLALACEVGDEAAFQTLLNTNPGLIQSLTEDDRRRLPDAAQSNNSEAVRLMLAAGWPVDARGEYQMTALQWAAWHGNAGMVREILRYHPELECKDNDHHIGALGGLLHGSENGWHRDTGDYVATLELLLAAGAKAPKVTPDLEASEAVREALLQHEQSLSAT